MADDDATAFVLRLGRALHALGYSSHRIEDLLADAAERLKLEGQFFTTPTSIFSAFGPQERQRTFLVRVEPGDLHLERLGRVQDIAEEVLAGRMPPRAGLAALDALDREPPRWGVAVSTLAFGVAGGSAACLLGGGGAEIAVAAALAMLTGWVAVAGVLPRDFRRFHEPFAAFVVSFAVSALATRMPLSTYLATLGGLIVLLPGLTLSAAMSELNAQHLVSGTARLTGAIMRFLVLLFGVALGSRVAQAFFGAAHSHHAGGGGAGAGVVRVGGAGAGAVRVHRAHARAAQGRARDPRRVRGRGDREPRGLQGTRARVGRVRGLARRGTAEQLARPRAAHAGARDALARAAATRAGQHRLPEFGAAARQGGRERHRGGVPHGDHVRGAGRRAPGRRHRGAGAAAANGSPVALRIPYSALRRIA